MRQPAVDKGLNSHTFPEIRVLSVVGCLVHVTSKKSCTTLNSQINTSVIN